MLDLNHHCPACAAVVASEEPPKHLHWVLSDSVQVINWDDPENTYINTLDSFVVTSTCSDPGHALRALTEHLKQLGATLSKSLAGEPVEPCAICGGGVDTDRPHRVLTLTLERLAGDHGIECEDAWTAAYFCRGCAPVEVADDKREAAHA